MNQFSDRDTSLDQLRIIALFLIVLVHTVEAKLGVSSISQISVTILFFLGKLGVPIFVMISGALLLPKKEPPLLFYKKRVRKIFLPWFFWALLLFFYKMSIGSYDTESNIQLLKQFIVVILSDFWFLPMILGVYVLTPYLRVLVTSKIQMKYLLITWCVITSILPFIYLSPLFPGSSSAGILSMSLSFSGYFLLGWYVHTRRSKFFSLTQLLIMLVGSTCFYLGSSYFFKSNDHALFFALQDYFSPPIITGSITLFLLISKNSEKISTLISARFTTILSKISYGIFLSHILVSSIVSMLIPEFFQSYTGINSWLIKAILVYSCSAALLYSCSHIPYLKKIVT